MPAPIMPAPALLPSLLALPFPTHLHSPHPGAFVAPASSHVYPNLCPALSPCPAGLGPASEGEIRHLTSKPCQSEPGLQWRSEINQGTIWPENVCGGRLPGAPGEERGLRLVSADISGDAFPMARPHTLVRQPEGGMAPADLIPPHPCRVCSTSVRSDPMHFLSIVTCSQSWANV